MPTDLQTLRCLLLQVRDPGDPMAPHEIHCFTRALAPNRVVIEIFDLLRGPLDPSALVDYDFILMGGSGAYSAVGTADWLDAALDSLRAIHASGIPAFASCWGFQGMARAMGGEVAHDLTRAEVGTYRVSVTEAGRRDPLFRYLGSSFKAQMGHEDLVVELPPNTTLLASSDRVLNQAYRFDDAPIYCTQFHPELQAEDIVHRLAGYPRYLEKVAGVPVDELVAGIEETPGASELVRRFLDLLVVGSPVEVVDGPAPNRPRHADAGAGDTD